MKEKINQLTCKKHIKIFKLHQIGLSNKEISKLVNTNAGHVYNVLKEYKGNEEKRNAADAIVIPDEVEA